MAMAIKDLCPTMGQIYLSMQKSSVEVVCLAVAEVQNISAVLALPAPKAASASRDTEVQWSCRIPRSAPVQDLCRSQRSRR